MEVILRPVAESDIDRIYSWVSNRWYVEDFAGSSLPTPEAHREYYDRVLREGLCYLAAELDGSHVGMCGVKGVSHGDGEIWYYIGDPELRGRGIGTKLVGVLLEYAKGELGLKRVHARILESNQRSRRVLEKNGFVLERLDGAHDGTPLVLYSRSL